MALQKAINNWKHLSIFVSPDHARIADQLRTSKYVNKYLGITLTVCTAKQN